MIETERRAVLEVQERLLQFQQKFKSSQVVNFCKIDGGRKSHYPRHKQIQLYKIFLKTNLCLLDVHGTTVPHCTLHH